MGPRPRPGQLREANNLLEILWQLTLRKQESPQSSEDGPADRDARRGPSVRGGCRMWWRHQTAWTSGEGAASCTLVLYLGTTNASHKPVEQSWSWASRTHQCGAGPSGTVPAHLEPVGAQSAHQRGRTRRMSLGNAGGARDIESRNSSPRGRPPAWTCTAVMHVGLRA